MQTLSEHPLLRTETSVSSSVGDLESSAKLVCKNIVADSSLVPAQIFVRAAFDLRAMVCCHWCRSRLVSGLRDSLMA